MESYICLLSRLEYSNMCTFSYHKGYYIPILELKLLFNLQSFKIELATQTLLYGVNVGLSSIFIYKGISFSCTKEGFIILNIIFIFTIKVMLTIEIGIGIIVPLSKITSVPPSLLTSTSPFSIGT